MKTSLSVYKDLATMSRSFFVSVLNSIFWAPGLEAVEKKKDKGLLLFNKGTMRFLWEAFKIGTNPESLLDNILFI